MPAPLLFFLAVLLVVPHHARADDLIVLLQFRSCSNCNLSDVNLVHADLRNAGLKGANLLGANLGRTRLDRADLRDADLRFSSLHGASLRSADLRGAQLDGADLRKADLSGCQINPGSLERSHWHGSIGIDQGLLRSSSLHNAGVDEAEAGRWPQAEHLFGQAIQANPEQPMSWIARGLSRGHQGDVSQAAQDILHGAYLLDREGALEQSEQLRHFVRKIQLTKQVHHKSGNGVGSSLLGGTISTLEALAPLALKTLIPGRILF